jgi:hypothetical protein
VKCRWRAAVGFASPVGTNAALLYVADEKALHALSANSVEGMVRRQGRLPDHAMTTLHVWMNCLDSSALPLWFPYARLHTLGPTNRSNQGHERL